MRKSSTAVSYTHLVEEISFEDTKLFIPTGWEHQLTQVYGDYMKLPPKEKQVPEHSDMEITIYG